MHWSLVAAKGAVPEPRGYHTASLIGEKILIFGGSDTQSCFSDTILFDTSNHFNLSRFITNYY